MKTIIAFTLSVLCFAIHAQDARVLKSLYLLAGGTWQMKTNKGFIGERWKKVNDNHLQSVGFKVIGKDTAVEERVRVIKKDGNIYYIPTVTNQNKGKEVYFKLTSSTKGEFIFSNPTHDFPQRVIYQFITPDSLHAWVDGQYNGKYVKQSFHYKRVR